MTLRVPAGLDARVGRRVVIVRSHCIPSPSNSPPRRFARWLTQAKPPGIQRVRSAFSIFPLASPSRRLRFSRLPRTQVSLLRAKCRGSPRWQAHRFGTVRPTPGRDSPAFRPLHCANAIRCGGEKCRSHRRDRSRCVPRPGNCRDPSRTSGRPREEKTPEAAMLRISARPP